MSDPQLYDPAAEVAVLAACLTSKPAREEAKRHLVAADFYQPRHEALWVAMCRLDHHGKPVDAQTILSVIRQRRGLPELLNDVVTTPAIPEHVSEYAETVRAWSTRRRIATTAQQVHQQALNPELNAVGYAASVANQFAAIRDVGSDDEQTARTLADVLADPDDEPDWLIPGYFERRDRMMLTGHEGLGKSHLLRQFAICAAAGLDPFDASRYRPVRAMIVDCENSDRQVKAKARGIAAYARHYGDEGAADRTFIACTRRMDITRDRDLAWLHRELDLYRPDLLVIGPLYRLLPRAIQTDDDAAPVLAALDTLRDRDVALLIEAHAGHAVGHGGRREMRPRGSSALLGWPEFGYGMRDAGNDMCDFIPWRGDRTERQWPHALRRDRDGVRWLAHDGPMEANAWSA